MRTGGRTSARTDLVEESLDLLGATDVLFADAIVVMGGWESLTRLEEISHHTTISKGVHTVTVVLHFYNSSFTEIENFGSFYTQEFERQTDMYENDKILE